MYTMLQVGPDWQQVIQKISCGRYLPLLLVYADHDDVRPFHSQRPLTRVDVKGCEPSGTGGGHSQFTADGKSAHNIRRF